MSLVLFEGAAGTGKTRKLVESVRKQILETPLGEDQKILALTKLHGSRRLLLERLSEPGSRPSADCSTIDSFAWNLVRRWRGLARSLPGGLPHECDFQQVTECAATLLEKPGVAAWVSSRYPLVVVDELQDCKGGEVGVVRGLAGVATCFCSADEFQDLSGQTANEAVTWARQAGVVVNLTTIHRTTAAELLAAATALRAGTAVPTERTKSFRLSCIPSAAAGGAMVVWQIKSWLADGTTDVAIISPTRASTDAFAADLVEWISTRTSISKKGDSAGPYPTRWECADTEAVDILVRSLGVSDGVPDFDCRDLAATSVAVAPDLRDWLLRHASLTGQRVISAAAVRTRCERLIHIRRAFGNYGVRRRTAMTIHQAKNREFEAVVVLWPYRLKSDPEQLRRLLYNAVTRARKAALIVVLDPKNERLRKPPFFPQT